MPDRNVLIAYQIILGARNDSPNAIFKASDVTKLHAVLRKYFSGYTIVDGQGYWRDDAGVLYWEHSKVITLFINEATDGKKIESFAGQIKQHFEQYCVSQIRLGPAAFL